MTTLSTTTLPIDAAEAVQPPVREEAPRDVTGRSLLDLALAESGLLNLALAETIPVPALPPMTLYVCVTCRDAGYEADRAAGRPCAGTRLHEALKEAALVDGTADPALRIVGVECLSACKRPCAVSFAAPGKWTYVFGDLAADEAAATVVAGARLYAESPDGIIPWKLRADVLKKGAVARVPAS